jgi:putative Holliday junction resolvase
VNQSIRTIIAFDFGLRQIGIAVGNAVTASTQPLTTIRAKEGIPQWPEVEKILKEWQPDMIVVGEPLNMDGSDGELTERARKFGRRVHGRFGLPVENMDERLSSFEAKQSLRELGHSGDYKTSPIDSYAAELILRTWMAEKGLI